MLLSTLAERSRSLHYSPMAYLIIVLGCNPTWIQKINLSCWCYSARWLGVVEAHYSPMAYLIIVLGCNPTGIQKINLNCWCYSARWLSVVEAPTTARWLTWSLCLVATPFDYAQGTKGFILTTLLQTDALV